LQPETLIASKTEKTQDPESSKKRIIKIY
jgi:hypothetical protein